MKWTEKGHQFDALGEQFKDRKKIYIYGAGENGRYVYEKIKFLNCVEGFIDKEVGRKETYLGKNILSLKEVLQEESGTYLIIVAVSRINFTNVVKTLVAKGLRDGSDFFEYSAFIDFYLHVYAVYTYNRLYHKGVCLIPTRRCPLNCKNCLNFIPYVRERWEDGINKVREELDLLFSCVDYLGILSIAGGEIFLYPHYKELFLYIGENYRDKIDILSVTTSAAIIPDDETFQIFEKYGFTIHISDYRQALPRLEKTYAQFIKKLEVFKVKYVQFENHEWLDIDVFGEDKALTDEDKCIHFDACGIPWQLIMDGKLYACNWAGFAVMSGVKPEYESDYYDLRTCVCDRKRQGQEEDTYEFMFREEKRNELMEFIVGYSDKGYVEMCGKCNGYSTINHHFIPAAIQIPRQK